jgi:CheY-like chemotaxis protein
MKPVLVVEHDAETREEIAGWLEAEGMEVLVCPGPAEPDYSCLGGRGERCPLAEAVDLVVCDMSLAPEEALRGVPSWVILLYYVERGKRVIALSGGGDAVHPLEDQQVRVVMRPPQRQALINAVRSFYPETDEVSVGHHLAR